MFINSHSDQDLASYLSLKLIEILQNFGIYDKSHIFIQKAYAILKFLDTVSQSDSILIQACQSCEVSCSNQC